MQLYSLFIAFFGFLSTLAAANQCTGNKSNPGYCETLTYEDLTSNNGAPPSTSQCESTCKDVTTDAGDWSVNFKGKPAGYVDHMVNSACSFSVGRVSFSASVRDFVANDDKGDGEPNDYQFYMDNQDIIDIIDEVNRRFGGAHSGRVSARGTMKCQGHLATWYVD